MIAETPPSIGRICPVMCLPACDANRRVAPFRSSSSPIRRSGAWPASSLAPMRSIFLMNQAIGKHSMIPRKSGRIINVASIAGLAGSRDLSTVAYQTSKAAVINFTRSLAGEWGKFGINVNALAPGFFPSRMTKGLLDQYGADNMARHAPLRRLGDDDDLKGATLLFASQAGKHITGQILPIDGGVSAVIAA